MITNTLCHPKDPYCIIKSPQRPHHMPYSRKSRQQPRSPKDFYYPFKHQTPEIPFQDMAGWLYIGCKYLGSALLLVLLVVIFVLVINGIVF